MVCCFWKVMGPYGLTIVFEAGARVQRKT
jgi:hypothetical protein